MMKKANNREKSELTPLHTKMRCVNEKFGDWFHHVNTIKITGHNKTTKMLLNYDQLHQLFLPPNAIIQQSLPLCLPLST